MYLPYDTSIEDGFYCDEQIYVLEMISAMTICIERRGAGTDPLLDCWSRVNTFCD